MSSSSSWISRREADKQYRPKGYGLSAGLQRARAPFRTRNALTGALLGAFIVGVWAYSISAVKQDTFEDMDEEAKELLAARMTDERIRAEEAQRAPAQARMSNSATETKDGVLSGKVASDAQNASTSSNTHGLLAAQLHRHFPHVLDPTSRTIVWGAPPVDRIGRLGDKNDRPA